MLAICAIGFGFAPSFLFAVGTRFLWGLLNGNIGVAKTYLGEISDDSNAAKGMALFGVIGGLGRTIGPIIGGFLSSPAQHYPAVYGGTIFDKYPYALPSLVISGYCILVLVVSVFLLPETLPPDRISNSCCVFRTRQYGDGYSLLRIREEGRSESGSIEMSDLNSTDLCNQTSCGDTYPLGSGISENTPQRKKSLSFADVVKVKIIDHPELSFQSIKGIGKDEQPVGIRVWQEISGVAGDPEGGIVNIRQYSNGSDLDTGRNVSTIQKFVLILRQKSIGVTTLMYGTNAFVSIVVNEVFPLWVVTSRQHGGFELEEHQIGIITMIGGLLSVLLQVTVYPKLIETIGILNVIRLGIFLFAVGCALTPASSMVTSLNWKPIEFFMITCSQLLLGVTSTWVLISVFVLINNSCYSRQRATVNGIGQTFASCGRLLGPYTGAVLFAWSETNNFHWPLNYYFVFYMLVFVSLGNWCLTGLLPSSIQRRKREPVIPTDEEVEEFLRQNNCDSPTNPLT